MLLNSIDVQKILNISQAKAYQVIRILNDELDKKGYLTIRGRVPEDYLKQRFKIEYEEFKKVETVNK